MLGALSSAYHHRKCSVSGPNQPVTRRFWFPLWTLLVSQLSAIRRNMLYDLYPDCAEQKCRPFFYHFSGGPHRVGPSPSLDPRHDRMRLTCSLALESFRRVEPHLLSRLSISVLGAREFRNRWFIILHQQSYELGWRRRSGHWIPPPFRILSPRSPIPRNRRES